MQTLYDYLKTHNNILSCPRCKRNLYKIILPEERHSLIKAEQFTPMHNDIPKPKAGDEMLCPFCKASLVIDYGRWEKYHAS